MRDKKKIKKRGRILYLLSTIVLILIAIAIVYFTFYYKTGVDSKLVTSIDFSKCTKGTCTYKVELDNEIYELKYENIENPEGEGLEAILSKLYLNDKVIINVLEYDRVLDMNILNDLLVFGKKASPSASGHYLEIFDKNGLLVLKIDALDKDLAIYPSPVKEIYLGEDGYSDLKIDTYFYKIKSDTLKIYGTKFNDSWEVEINGKYSMIDDFPELILNGEISASEIFSGIYEITYDELINGKTPKLKEITQTNGEVAKVFED